MGSGKRIDTGLARVRISSQKFSKKKIFQKIFEMSLRLATGWRRGDIVMKIFLIEDKSGLSYFELKYSEVRFGLFRILEIWNILDY